MVLLLGAGVLEGVVPGVVVVAGVLEGVAVVVEGVAVVVEGVAVVVEDVLSFIVVDVVVVVVHAAKRPIKAIRMNALTNDTR